MSVEQAGNTIRDLHLVIGGETLDFKHALKQNHLTKRVTMAKQDSQKREKSQTRT